MKVLKPTTIPFPSSGQFIRASTATYIEDGVLKVAAANEPRWQDGKLLVEKSATNFVRQSQNLTVSWTGCQRVISTETYKGYAPFYEVSKLLTTTSEGTSCTSFPIVAGNTVTLTVAMLAGSTSVATLGIRGSLNESVTGFWGAVADCSWEVLEGPGLIEVYSPSIGGLREIVNLSATIPTVVRITRTYLSNQNSIVTMYPGKASSVVVGASVKMTRVQMEMGFVATSYIPTTTLAVTRAADICIGNFSRSSVATYMDSNRVLQTANIDVPRIQNNKLLIEQTAINYIRNSQTFNTNWSLIFVTTSSTASTSPSASAARQLSETNQVGSSHSISQTVDAGTWSGKTLTCSVYLKARSRNFVVLEFGQGSSSCNLSVNLTDGAATKLQAGFVGETYNVELISSGWYRVSVTAKMVGNDTPFMQVKLSTDGTTTVYDGVTGFGVDIFGAQIEEGVGASSYIETTNSPVTRAADIHSAGLVYTTAVDARPQWSSATTYSIGQIILYRNTVYESLQASNTNRQPDTNPTWWLSKGADNISAAFDGKIGSKTTATGKLRMIIYPGTTVDSVGYVEVGANVVNTSVIDEDYNLIYSNSTGLSSVNIEDWYGYFFNSPLSEPSTQTVHQGISSINPGLFVGVELIGNVIELGSLLTGLSTTIGNTQYGLKSGIVDYSKKEADEFGNITIVERPYSKRMSADVYVKNYDLNKVQRFLYGIRATPVLWMASDNPELAEVSNVYGFYKDFSTTISYPDVSMCNLEIEGLI